jgi:hypothetical protein
MGDVVALFEAKKTQFEEWLKTQPPAVRCRTAPNYSEDESGGCSKSCSV